MRPPWGLVCISCPCSCHPPHRLAQALREHTSTSHTGHGGNKNSRLPVLPHADTGARRAGAGVVRVPSSTAHCFAWPHCCTVLATPIGLHPISKAAGGAARIAAGMPVGAGCGVGYGAAASHCGKGTGALEPHGCDGGGGQCAMMPSTYADPQPQAGERLQAPRRRRGRARSRRPASLWNPFLFRSATSISNTGCPPFQITVARFTAGEQVTAGVLKKEG